MSSTWSGFSEDDIEKLKCNNKSEEVDDKYRRVIKAKRRTEHNKLKRIKPDEKQNLLVVDHSIPEDAKLSKNETIKTSESQNKLVASSANGTNENKNCITLDVNKIEKNVINLDEFQTRQKRMEEQNRRRKELLAKALADRTKKTEEEARRLKEIQNEFKKLDALLSNDVAILRHQIEIASLDFMEAQKRYHKIERDFLEAKLYLHQKLERKEMLTEHLCAIIEKNEERKATKLNELMNRLTINGTTLFETYENENQTEEKVLNTNGNDVDLKQEKQ